MYSSIIEKIGQARLQFENETYDHVGKLLLDIQDEVYAEIGKIKDMGMREFVKFYRNNILKWTPKHTDDSWGKAILGLQNASQLNGYDKLVPLIHVVDALMDLWLMNYRKKWEDKNEEK